MLACFLRASFPQGAPSCGSLTQEGMQVAEAAKWAVRLLNQDSGEVFGSNVADSFIPGIKLGLHVMDACGMRNRAVQLAMQNMQYLYAPRQSCVFNETRISLGFISNVERRGMRDIAEFLRPYGKPFLSLLPETELLKRLDVLSIISGAETVASAIVHTAHRLRLQQIWLIYENTDYGREGRDSFTRLAGGLQVCLLGMSWFDVESQSNDDVERILDKVLSYYPRPVCIVLFMSRSIALSFLKAGFTTDEMRRRSSQVEWIISDGFDGSFVELFSRTRGIFIVTDENPHRVPEFLAHYKTEVPSHSSSSRLREYYQEKRKCRLSG
ncbi:hypothetical protein M514_10515, partial [Trichuris suis]